MEAYPKFLVLHSDSLSIFYFKNNIFSLQEKIFLLIKLKVEIVSPLQYSIFPKKPQQSVIFNVSKIEFQIVKFSSIKSKKAYLCAQYEEL